MTFFAAFIFALGVLAILAAGGVVLWGMFHAPRYVPVVRVWSPEERDWPLR